MLEDGGQWGKAVSIYGLQFLLRIHFRKYQFDLITKIIQSGGIKEKEDLKWIGLTLEKMATRFDSDPELRKHSDRMSKLQTIVADLLDGKIALNSTDKD